MLVLFPFLRLLFSTAVVMLKGEQKSAQQPKREVSPGLKKKTTVVKAGNAQKSKREKSKKEKSKKEKSKKEKSKKKSSLKDSKKKKIPKKLQKKQLVGGEMSTAKAIPSQESCNEKKSRQEVVGKSRMEKIEKSQFSKFEDAKRQSATSVENGDDKAAKSKELPNSKTTLPTKSPPIEQPEQQAAATWLKEILAKSVNTLAGEYKPNQESYEPAMVETSMINHDDNRYNNMPCLEKTRIKVPGVKNDYIHANYVGPSDNPKRYICTQGPLDDTIEKFWRMVIADGCEVIIMLCEFSEGGEDKCAKYYPDQVKGSLTFGPITIKCYGRSEEELNGRIVTTLLEVTLGQEKAYVVRHSKFVGWPDHGVPGSAQPLLKMVHRARGSKKPVVIHCSAGIGRTGTCALVAVAQDELRKGEFRGLWPLLQRIREQRAFSVQNKKQYVFAYRCLVDRAVDKGIAGGTGPDMEKFQRDYEIFMAGSSKKKKVKRVPSKEGLAMLPPAAEQKTPGLG